MDETNFSDKFLITYKKDEIVFRENTPGTHMYVINSGSVNIFKLIEGSDVLITTLSTGDIFGEMALFDDSPRSASAIAAEDNTTLLIIDNSLFVYLVGQQPAFALTILKALSVRLRNEVERIKKLSIEKSLFLANMSYKLRTPLNDIIGYSEMLQEDARDTGNEEMIPDFQNICISGKNVLDFINDIIDLSMIDAGKMTLYLETFDVVHLINEILSTVQPIINKNSNVLKIKCAENLGEIYSDKTKVRQVLFTLLSNASKFTDKGTVIFEATRSQPDGNIIFKIQDSGIGMTSEQLSKLFKPLTRTDNLTSSDGSSGLGLLISRKYCLMMGGDMKVESETVKGTTFTVTLPVKVSK